MQIDKEPTPNETNEVQQELNTSENEIAKEEGSSITDTKTLELQEQINELQDKLLRAIAESENTRRRYEKMVEDAKAYAIFNFSKDLLTVLDNLNRALEHHNQQSSDSTNHSYLSNIIDGVSMTKTELESIFAKYEIISIQPKVGDKFDYNVHHAISQVPTEEYKEGTIVNIMQIGYKIKDRLLRPATVAVSVSNKDE